MSTILEELTPDDIRHLVQFEDELTQLGRWVLQLIVKVNCKWLTEVCVVRFEKVFPTCDTHLYHQYFEAPRYYNMMFDAWESRYHNKRSEGINLLESLCQQKIHLSVPFPGGRTKVSEYRLLEYTCFIHFCSTCVLSVKKCFSRKDNLFFLNIFVSTALSRIFIWHQLWYCSQNITFIFPHETWTKF